MIVSQITIKNSGAWVTVQERNGTEVAVDVSQDIPVQGQTYPLIFSRAAAAALHEALAHVLGRKPS